MPNAAERASDSLRLSDSTSADGPHPFIRFNNPLNIPIRASAATATVAAAGRPQFTLSVVSFPPVYSVLYKLIFTCIRYVFALVFDESLC